MRTSIQLLFLFLLTGFLFACGAPEGESVEAGEAMEDTDATSADAVAYTVDATNSVIQWTGSKPTGSTHNGIVKLQGGTLSVENGQLVDGEFTIDMTTIEDQDLTDPDKKGKLEGHLNSPDFFAVEQFPTAKFVITEVMVANEEGITHRIQGNLTMRDSTKSITIPANVAIAGGELSAVTPAFNIDRKKWNVMYNSSSVVDRAKDEFINDEINLVIDLKATKPSM